MENWKRFLEGKYPRVFEYESILERFSIRNPKNHPDAGIIINVQFIRRRGNSKAADKEVTPKGESKMYRNSKGRSIQYQKQHSYTPNHDLLKNEPFQMQLIITKRHREDLEVIDEKVYNHYGLTPTPEMQRKYEEAKKGLIDL